MMSYYDTTTNVEDVFDIGQLFLVRKHGWVSKNIIAIVRV